MKLVDDSGWRGARLPELRGDINAATREKLGNVSTEGDSVVGQLQAVQAEDDLQFVEAAGWLYGGFFISQGEGIQLDGAGEILGVKRIGLTQSIARVVYLLDNGQEVAAGDEFTINGIDGDWLVSTPLVATPTRCNGLILAVKEAQLIADNVFVISVNGTDYSTVYEDGDTSDSIIGRLFGIITAAEKTQTVSDTKYGTLLHVADGYTEANYTFSDLVFDVIKVGEPAQGVYQSDTVFPSVQYGDIISDDILVLSAGITGYLIEGDTSYRRRLQAAAGARSIGAGASRPGIKRAVSAVLGVTFCDVIVNRGITTDANGLPGKSVHVFVAGGDDDAIAQAIWTAAAGEANTFGVSYGIATDGETSETMYFDRQAFQLVYVTVSDPVWDKEVSDEPDDFIPTARAIVQDYFSSLGVGRDVFAGQIGARLIVAFKALTMVAVKVGIVSPPTDKSVPMGSGVVAVITDDSVKITGETT